MDFKFPDTGEGVTEGQFLEWKVEEGDEVEEDQIVGEAETDKAVVDIPAPADGKVRELKASPGDTVSVGDVIMILDPEEESGEERSEEEAETEIEAEEESADDQEDSDQSENKESEQVDAVMGGSPSASSYDDEEDEETSEDSDGKEETGTRPESADVLAMPRVRKKAREKGIDLEELDVEGRIKMKDLEGAESKGYEKESQSEVEDSTQENKSEEPENEEEASDVDVSKDVNARPSVRKLARKHHIELSMVDGSGRDGEITREDVLKAAGEMKEGSESEEINTEEETDEKAESTDEPHKSDEKPEVETEGDVERVQMSGVRKITAERMAQSSRENAQVTHIEKADITELVELRESIKSDVDAHLTYLPFIMKACVAALREHPRLNSEFDGEHNEIIQKNFYDFNIAVDTERGLMVPKIEGIDKRNMVELAEQIAEKASRAQKGDLNKSELEPGTFSITNLGVIGGEAFTPIIYPPQSAILGIGKIQETAEVVGGEVMPRKTVKLSLSYDHRVVDGAEAAKFMSKVVEDLENPKNLIIDI
ncbi:MAG: dihydrolipoamide acetyltransferase family protein [Candidatus Nanohaloarchaea archaeon]